MPSLVYMRDGAPGMTGWLPFTRATTCVPFGATVFALARAALVLGEASMSIVDTLPVTALCRMTVYGTVIDIGLPFVNSFYVFFGIPAFV